MLSTLMQRGQGMSVFFLVAPAACWLIAWASLAMIAFLTVYRVLRILLFTPKVYTRDIHDARQMAGTRYPVQPGAAQGAVQQWSNNQPLYPGPARTPPIEPSIAYPQWGQSMRWEKKGKYR
jgi:hypothetical protein